MLLSSGLLLIYVILCVASFITARREMAHKRPDAAKKAAVLKKAAKRIDTPIIDAKSEKKEESLDSNKAAPSLEKPSEHPKKEDSDQSKEDSSSSYTKLRGTKTKEEAPAENQ